MPKKIVAIGGGENGRVLENGNKTDYETEEMDKEIIKLSGKEKPNFLFLEHAINDKIIQESYYQTMKKIYKDRYGCNCKNLTIEELDNKDLVLEKIEWADIIYEGGGDTFSMIKLWKEKGFNDVLFDAWTKGKVISGISAGAVCWFNSCNSEIDNNYKKFNTVKCLDWINLFITPHIDENGRLSSTREQLKSNKKVGILLSNRSAIEIIDNKYRIIINKAKAKKKPFVIKAYWKDNKFIKKELKNYNNYKLIENLFNE